MSAVQRIAWLSCAIALAAPSAGAAAATPFVSVWCHGVPLGKAFCSTLVVNAPKTTLRLAVADTDPRREHGLMGVRSVPAAEGMLFSFPDGDMLREFWMKDTVTPLDMIWVRGDGLVTTVASNVPATKPRTPDDQVARRRGVGKYVIELGAGGAKRAGIEPGVRLPIPDVAAQ
jgi:uncharacterized protein